MFSFASSVRICATPRIALVAAAPSPPEPPPASALIAGFAPALMTRTRMSLVSATTILLLESTDTPRGKLKDAVAAGPPSPHAR